MSPNKHRLFRQQAMDSVRPNSLGAIILIPPPSFAVLTLVSLILAGALVLLLGFGTYTQRSTVLGQLVADGGLARVYSPQSGIVVEQRVTEGQAVEAGTLMWIISSERYNESRNSTQEAISRNVHDRVSSLQMQMDDTRSLQEQQRRDARSKIDGEQIELTKIADQIRSQTQRIQIAQASEARYQKLSEGGTVAPEQLQQKDAEVLDQRARLQDLERDQIYHQRELTAAREAQQALILTQRNQSSQLQRDLAVTSQEFTESEAKRRLAVTAPVSGIVTVVYAHVGQAVDSARPLASILPSGDRMHAELYVPSRSIGFIGPGARVMLRYQAYPYQKFGHQEGVVQSVSRTALPAAELNAMSGAGVLPDNEPAYLVTVNLKSQSIAAYGKQQTLQPGMLLDADILREKRRLYEWALEPLYSLSGRL